MSRISSIDAAVAAAAAGGVQSLCSVYRPLTGAISAGRVVRSTPPSPPRVSDTDDGDSLLRLPARRRRRSRRFHITETSLSHARSDVSSQLALSK